MISDVQNQSRHIGRLVPHLGCQRRGGLEIVRGSWPTEVATLAHYEPSIVVIFASRIGPWSTDVVVFSV